MVVTYSECSMSQNDAANSKVVTWTYAVAYDVRTGRPKPMKNECERTTSEGTGFGKLTNYNSSFMQFVEVIHRN